MDLELTEEQKLLQKSVREFAESEVKPLAKELDETGHFPRGLFKKAAEFGLTGVAFPEAEGGAGFDHVAYSIGAAYVQLGQLEEARHWLSRAVDTGFPCYPWFERDPLLKPLRDDPEFRTFMSKLRRSWQDAKSRYAIS